MTVAKTLETAAVGDKVWVNDPHRPRPARLETVCKVARVYLYVGDPDRPRSWSGYDRENGAAKPQGGYTSSERAAGSEEMAEWALMDLRRTLARKIEGCSDPVILRAVALALGIEPPTNFDIEPETTKP